MGTTLRERLDLAGVRQVDLARRSGVSKATLCRALKGERRLREDVEREAERMIRERVAEAARALVGAA